MAAFADLPAPPGTRFGPVRLVTETGSTNADLLAAAGRAEPEGSVLVADHQRAGRGRQRRVWHDEPGGSLLVSVLLRPRSATAPLIPLVTGLAAVEAVQAMAEAVRGDVSGRSGPGLVGLKWPNDVLAPGHGERKLAGILAEATSGGRVDDSAAAAADPDRLTVVVGMGLNLRWVAEPPAEVADRAVTLAELVGHDVDRDRVLSAYLTALERWYARLERGQPVLDRYRAACLTIGRGVRFVTAGGQVDGRALDVSDDGTLIVETDDGDRVELHAGDAHHR